MVGRTFFISKWVLAPVKSCLNLSPRKPLPILLCNLARSSCLSEQTATPSPPFYVIAVAQQAHAGLSDRCELNSSAQDLDKERMKVFCQGTANTGHYVQ